MNEYSHLKPSEDSAGSDFYRAPQRSPAGIQQRPGRGVTRL